MRSMVRLPTVGRHRDSAHQTSADIGIAPATCKSEARQISGHAPAGPIELKLRRVLPSANWPTYFHVDLVIHSARHRARENGLWRLGPVLPSSSTARPRPGTATSTSYELCRCWW